MPKLSPDLFLEKWASAKFGAGNFRSEVYKILTKFGVSPDRAWQLTNRIRRYAAAYSHFFDVNDAEMEENEDGVDRIWNFIRGMTYKVLLEEFEETATTPRQRSRLIKGAMAQMSPQQRALIVQYTLTEDLESILKNFEAEFPEYFFREIFFKAKAEQIRQSIENEKAAIEHINKRNKRPKKKEVAAYIDAVDDLKQQILKTLTPEPSEEEPAS